MIWTYEATLYNFYTVERSDTITLGTFGVQFMGMIRRFESTFD
jgi:hypothetical protein